MLDYLELKKKYPEHFALDDPFEDALDSVEYLLEKGVDDICEFFNNLALSTFL